MDKARRRHEVKAVHGFRKFFRTYTEPKIGSLNAMILMNKFITTCTTNYEKAIRLTIHPNPTRIFELDSVLENIAWGVLSLSNILSVSGIGIEAFAVTSKI